jgi:hypothetical protein
MMKITFCNGSETAELKVAGKLAGPWVDELEKTWHAVSPAAKSETLLVDLCQVTFVDAEGKRLLEQMHKAGVELVGDGIMTRYLIEKIKQDGNGHKNHGHKNNGNAREENRHEDAPRHGNY